MYKKLGHFSKSSRGLVRILDARQFGKNAYDFWSDQQTGTLGKAFERALTLLPNVNAILLDGHRDLDLAFLTVPDQRRQYGNLHVLSVAECRYQIPRLFFAAPSLQNVVYLDISYLPGSLLSVVQPAVLPALRILKVRGRELNDSRCLEMLGHLGLRLWSLDISDNNVTDSTVQAIKDWCISPWPLRTEAHGHAEGKLLSMGGGSKFHGPFLSIEDGDLSASFSHPERYYVDAPRYMAQSTWATQENHVSRSDGSSGIRIDTVEAATALLTAGDGPAETQDYRQSAGLTHLRVSNNQLSAVGIQKFLRISNGHIEDLTCDSLSLLPKDGQSGSFWPPDTNLRGILGAAHCFRPVMSPNLRVLRLHHSVVTNIPTLHMHGASYQARSHLAETVIRERAETLFPQTFSPDMNPRLSSLTLTCLPRRSCGPLISKLKQFLKLLSDQERAIQDISRTVSTRRSPGLLKGLRHLRLEFDHDDVMDDGFSASVNLVGKQLMESEDEMFSFFRDEQRVETQISAMQASSFANAALNSKGVAGESRPPRVDQSYFPDRDKSDFVTHDGRWNDEAFSVQVWIGPANPDAPEALRDYRRMVVEHDVRDGVGPVTPAQIKAGAPRSSFIYQIAWSAAVMPASLRVPEEDELAGIGMSDVLDALKAYRLESRSKLEQRRRFSTTQRNDVLLGNPHYFWTGTLEVSLEVKTPFSSRPTDWR